MMKVNAMVLLIWAAMANAATLQVSVPAITVQGATVGTEFDVPIRVSIPDGVSGQGLARLYVRILSSGSTNVIAPVSNGTQVFTSWGMPVMDFGAKIGSFLQDFDGDGDLDAGDTGLADMGNALNNSIGIGSSTVVMVQRWKFVANPTEGTNYTLAVQFPAAKSRGYNGAGQAVSFTTQTGMNGSVTMTAPSLPGDANGDGMVDVGDLGILASNYGGSGKTWTQGDFNGDGLVDVGDLGILAANYGTGVNGTVDFSADYAKAFGSTAAEEDSEDDSAVGSICGALGLPLVAGLMLMGLALMSGLKLKG